MKNARFHDLVNGSAVKITLRPGQELHHSNFRRTDEGWTHTAFRWTHEGSRIVCDYVNDGADCDGRSSYSCRTACNIDSLAAGFKSEDAHDFGIIYPKWQRLDEYQRDHTAEAAGY